MTDEELDGFLHRVLLDALQLEWSGFLEKAPPVETSKHYRHQMRKMVANPLAWYRKKTRPIWKKAFRAVAAFLMICSVAFGTLMVASPSARAAVLQWVREWYDTHIVYRYSGEPISTEIPQYEITELPAGYTETERVQTDSTGNVVYQNKDGTEIFLDYTLMQQGSAYYFDTENVDVIDVNINGVEGQFFLSHDPENSNMLTWIDTTENVQIVIDGFYDQIGMVHMSESVSLVEMTK
ncbi:hypothetical protein OBV_31380 [Oscillibacter valericigenes Sjm18-20]|nr:hypothetical protein OBV_31380 [Oscillibacter valericigenes Sjm18-20]